MTDSEFSPNKGLTEFDILRLQDLDKDDSFTTESGYWTIHHYGKSLVLCGEKGEFKEFDGYDKVIGYLSKE